MFNTADFKNTSILFARNISIESERRLAFRIRLLLSYTLSKPFNFFKINTFVGPIAQINNRHIIGAIFARRFPLGKTWILGPIAVHPNFRRLNIATQTMNLLLKYLKEKKAKSVILSIERDNIAARRFFEKLNFKYLEPIFDDHDKARNYVLTTTLVHDYIRNQSYRIKQYPSRRRCPDLQRTKKTRIWYIMSKRL